MIKALKAFFDLSEQKPEETELAIHLCCIALMTTVASIDHEFDSSEQAAIIDLGKKLFNVDEETAHELLGEARDSSEASTSLYDYTSRINGIFNEQQKFDLITALWQVAFADGQLDRYEEHIIRRIADLIYLDHVRFMQAKHEALDR
jgi:uncharacterized tellurite resistance protein B-like protein